MKMTPEQKAFYEYGKAREALRIFKTDFAYREETLREFYESYVREAWRKRAVCRAWKATGGRSCYNCLYKNLPGCRRPCAMCEDETHWKSRKEGE